jgi:hypothetical protein
MGRDMGSVGITFESSNLIRFLPTVHNPLSGIPDNTLLHRYPDDSGDWCRSHHLMFAQIPDVVETYGLKFSR